MNKAEDHSAFLAEFTAELGFFFEVASSDIDRTSEFIEWFGARVFEHAYNHGVEDTMKASQESKTTPSVDEQVINHAQVPFTGFASRQEDIQKAWQTREDNQK